ncbi:MAG: hypothetical protein WB689_28965, partial [Xanthobacteraceae bacterium]
MHHLLVIAAIVVHYGEQRNPVPRRSPQHARRIHQVTVGLDRDREPAHITVGERARTLSLQVQFTYPLAIGGCALLSGSQNRLRCFRSISQRR